MPVSEADKAIISELNGLVKHCKDTEEAFKAAIPTVVKDSTYEGYFDERARHCGNTAHDLQTDVRRLGGEPDAWISSGGGGLKSMIAGKDDAAIYKILAREIDTSLKAHHDAQNEILRAVNSSNRDSAWDLVGQYIKQLEDTRKELGDLNIMSESI